jgi:hypothetical protein
MKRAPRYSKQRLFRAAPNLLAVSTQWAELAVRQSLRNSEQRQPTRCRAVECPWGPQRKLLRQWRRTHPARSTPRVQLRWLLHRW